MEEVMEEKETLIDGVEKRVRQNRQIADSVPFEPDEASEDIQNLTGNFTASVPISDVKPEYDDNGMFESVVLEFCNTQTRFCPEELSSFFPDIVESYGETMYHIDELVGKRILIERYEGEWYILYNTEGKRLYGEISRIENVSRLTTFDFQDNSEQLTALGTVYVTMLFLTSILIPLLLISSISLLAGFFWFIFSPFVLYPLLSHRKLHPLHDRFELTRKRIDLE